MKKLLINFVWGFIIFLGLNTMTMNAQSNSDEGNLLIGTHYSKKDPSNLQAFREKYSKQQKEVLTDGNYDVLVGGIYQDHDMDVLQAFLEGYSSYDGSAYTGTITWPGLGGLYSLFSYAEENGYEMIVYSYSGLYGGIYYAPNYPGVQLVMPAGSNYFIEIYTGDIENLPVIVTGAGEINNTTGYTIEFHSIDPIYNLFSSFSNGYIAGQIVYIAETLNITIQEARQLARETGSRNGNYDYFNGYGLIDIEAALPVELVYFAGAINGKNIELHWRTETEVNNYGFEIERLTTESADWSTIGFVEGNGNSNSPKQYKFIDVSINQSGTYKYRLKQIDNDGTYEYSDIVSVEVGVPNKFYLSQNYPNPFNPETRIDFTLPEKQMVNLKVYNALGEFAGELVNEVKEAGNYSITFDASNLPSGIYFYRIQAGDFVKVEKMILLK